MAATLLLYLLLTALIAYRSCSGCSSIPSVPVAPFVQPQLFDDQSEITTNINNNPPPRLERPTKHWRKQAPSPVASLINSSPTSQFSSSESSINTLDGSTEVEVDSATSELNHETNFVAECDMPTSIGNFRMRAYTYVSTDKVLEPIVVISGDVRNKENVLVRVHDQCFTSEVFGSMRCDCKEQLQESLKAIQKDGGIVIYLQQEGRGIGISNKIAAYKLQDDGFDTVDANTQLGFQDDHREYYCIPTLLNDLNIKSIRLMTNNPYKMDRITELGVKVSERIPLLIRPNNYNLGYIRSKQHRMNHMIPEDLTDCTLSQSIEIPAPASVEPTKEDCEHLRKDYAFGKHTVEAAIEAIRDGKMIIVVDDEGRENEGDLIMAAEMSTPEAIGFVVRHSSGVLCISMESDRLEELQLPPMVVNNQDPKQTAYTVSVDYKHGTTTGISAADRAACFRALADPASTAADFQRPGHVFPLRYRSGGVLTRGGHTEASMDFTRLAGLRPASVLAEVVNDDGTIKLLPDLIKMAEEFGLVLTSVQDLIAYRLEKLEEKTTMDTIKDE